MRQNRLPELLKSAALLFLYAVSGIAVGVGAIRIWQWHQAREAVQTFAITNQHQGDYRALVSSVGHGRPIMVVMDGCHYCADARVWLTKHRISLQEIPIDSQPEVNAAMRRWNDHGTPTLITPGQLTVGFEPHAWAAALSGFSDGK